MARKNGSLFVVCRVSRSVVPDSLRPHGLQPIRLFCPWDLPGKDTGVGCHLLLQGIFPTQGSNLHLLHCGQIIYRWATREALLSLRFQLKYHFLRQAYSMTILTKYLPLLLSSQCNHLFSFKAIITICKYTKNVLITLSIQTKSFKWIKNQWMHGLSHNHIANTQESKICTT